MYTLCSDMPGTQDHFSSINASWKNAILRNNSFTVVAYEVVSLDYRLPDRHAALDFVALLLLPGREQVSPDTQVCLHPLLNMLDQAVDPHGCSEDFDFTLHESI